MKKQAFCGILLFAILIIPPIPDLLESIMIVHMLVQLPLLIVSGWLMGQAVTHKYSRFFTVWNANGVPGILLVLIITTYWMLPRAMDEAIGIWYVELFKFVSLPFLTGIPLRDSWDKLKTVGKGFVVLNYLPMFALMSWLYIDSPIQLCNNYLETEQKTLGLGFLTITIYIVLLIVKRAFTDHGERIDFQET